MAAGVEVSEAEIDAQLDIIKSQFEDEVVYEQTLAAQGLTEAELRTQLAAELSVGPYLEQAIDTASITVTQEEIDEAYANAAMQQDLPPLEQVRDQVEQLVLQEKQQPLIDQHIAMLQEVADIEKFI